MYLGNGEYQFTKTSGDVVVMNVEDIQLFMAAMDEYVAKLLSSKDSTFNCAD